MKILGKLMIILLIPTVGVAGWDMSGRPRWNMITSQKPEKQEAPILAPTIPPVPEVEPGPDLPDLPKYGETVAVAKTQPRPQPQPQAQPRTQVQYYQAQVPERRTILGRMFGRFRDR